MKISLKSNNLIIFYFLSIDDDQRYPVNKPIYDENDLPRHYCFKIISHISETILGKKYLRILICLEKIKEPIENVDLNLDCISLELENPKEIIPESIVKFKEHFLNHKKMKGN